MRFCFYARLFEADREITNAEPHCRVDFAVAALPRIFFAHAAMVLLDSELELLSSDSTVAAMVLVCSTIGAASAPSFSSSVTTKK
jgi:hypothetical protein